MIPDRDYSDIIRLPHPDPARHARMSMEDRAAQFAPFAALTGYDDAIRAASENPPEEAVYTEAADML